VSFLSSFFVFLLLCFVSRPQDTKQVTIRTVSLLDFSFPFLSKPLGTKQVTILTVSLLDFSSFFPKLLGTRQVITEELPAGFTRKG